MRKIIVEKKGETTTTYDTTTDNYTTNYDDNDSSSYEDTKDKHGTVLNSISKSTYKKPSSGSRQDNFSKDEIKQKLEGFIALKSSSDKKLLTEMPIFKTWVRYINTETKQFRVGGLLMKVVYPDYIMLANTSKSLTWSVQLKDNIIFVRDPTESRKKEEAREKEDEIKAKLYDLYKQGKLKKT